MSIENHDLHKTEYEIFKEAFKRIDQFSDYYSTNEPGNRVITARAYYEARLTFDEEGRLIEIDTHP